MFSFEFSSDCPCFLSSLIVSLGQSFYFLKDAFTQNSLLDVTVSKAGSIVFECLSLRYMLHTFPGSLAFSFTGIWYF